MQPDPVSVVLRKACSLCWRPIKGEGTYWLQRLDGIDRCLCESCKTLLYPSVPSELADYEIRRIDGKVALAQWMRDRGHIA